MTIVQPIANPDHVHGVPQKLLQTTDTSQDIGVNVLFLFYVTQFLPKIKVFKFAQFISNLLPTLQELGLIGRAGLNGTNVKVQVAEPQNEENGGEFRDTNLKLEPEKSFQGKQKIRP